MKLINFFFMLFFLTAACEGFSQTIADSVSIKNEKGIKTVLNNLKEQQYLYSNQQEFSFINYLKAPEKIDYSLNLNYKETQGEKAIRKWNQFKNGHHTWPINYPEFRTEKYFFTTY